MSFIIIHKLQIWKWVWTGWMTGVVLELAIMSRESMGRGAPQTLAVFEELVKQAGLIARVDVVFRSDRDGPIA